MEEMAINKIDPNRKKWVDMVKSLCMIGVYVCHSETYYYGTEGLLGYIVHPFYVNAFFFISGYLLFPKLLNNNMLININDKYISELKNVVFRLIIPTLLFSSLIYIPKMLFHGNSVNCSRFIFNVFGGISYWFTSAMVVSQVVLLSIVFLIKKQSIWVYWVISILLFFIGWYMNSLRTGNSLDDFFPWFYQTGLEYSFIVTLGGLYGHYETKIDSYMRHSIAIVVVGYIFMMTIAWNANVKLMFMGLGGKCNIEGFLCIVCGIYLLVTLCKKMKSINWLTYIGKNSIIFYFFSGVYTAAVGRIILCLSEKMYMITLTVAMLSITLGIFSVYIINRYIPFIVDLRKLK